MLFSDYLKSVQLLNQEQFLVTYSVPALLFHSRAENLPDNDHGKTDAWLDHRTITLDETPSKTAEDKTIVFLRKSTRNPFKDIITIGRASNNDIVINKATISKAHAFLAYKNATWQIMDQQSSNSTYVDGTKLAPKVAHTLHDNSIIQFGFEVHASFYSPKGLWSYIQIHQPEKYSAYFSKTKHYDQSLSILGD
jgi:hypothetical protein